MTQSKGFHKNQLCLSHRFATFSFVSMDLSESESHLVVSDSLQPHGLSSARLICPWNSPGQNTGVGSHSLLEGIFLSQGSNPGLLHFRPILHHLNHQGSPGILKWEAYPFSRDLPNPGIEPGSLVLQADSLPGKPLT